ncbi:MAG: hypothetical protein Q7S51_09000 [Gallionellaceae bacterium]|nr:hypothetical protein [Gallionellaceae bacterium]
MSIITTLALRSLVLFLMVGSVTGLFVGAALILRQDWLTRVSKFTNRWVSTRRMTRPLEQPMNLDFWFYRYRRVSGSLMLVGAVFILYFFIARFDKHSVLSSLSKNALIPPALMSGVIDALVLISLIGAVLVFIVSLFLLFRPSLLRGLEHGSNRSSSLRRALKPLEIPRTGVDEYVYRNMQWVGVLVLLGSLYTLVGLASWLK